MRSLVFALILIPFLTLTSLAQPENRDSGANMIPVRLGESMVALNSPWKFHTGDDLRWADPAFDDSAWETIDLTPAPGAHDSDVGLTGYVPGWTAKGHHGYSGYAWYRARLSVEPHAEALALSGPFDVDDAYEVFCNGQLLGGLGDFSRGTPEPYSAQPRIFVLPRTLMSEKTVSTILVAVRVWMASSTLGAAPDVGGIHIAPALGTVSGAEARYRLEWLELIRGFFLEVLQGVAFMILAVMACSLIAFDRSNPTYLWLGAALVLTGLVRANLAISVWTQWESVRTFDLIENYLLYIPMFGAWTLAWWHWFRLQRTAWIPRATVILILMYMVCHFLNGALFSFALPHSISGGFHILSRLVRLSFALLLILIACRGIQHQKRDRWLALASLLLISIGLFADELTQLHVPSIWFPYGTGVARTQFAYAALDLTMFALLLRRLLLFAHDRGLSVELKSFLAE